MIRAIVFDFGGTLDGDGLHWLDRFGSLYAELGLQIPREQIRAAFDFAEQQSLGEPAIREARLEEMVARHLGWQWQHLGIANIELQGECVRRFVFRVRSAAARNVPILAALAQRGLRLGVISNGCGNTAVLCDELGYSPYLAVVLDSTCVGLSKPDPQFFRDAAERLALAAAEILMVGDSLERDIRPAKEIGMCTAWLNPTASKRNSAADFQLTRLAELRDLVLTSRE